MKQIIAIFCIFAFLVGEENQDLNSFDETNNLRLKAKQLKFLEEWGKFIKVGIGSASLGVFNALSGIYNHETYGFNISTGIMSYPRSDIQDLIFFDFDYFNSVAYKSNSESERLNGDDFVITLNYGLSDRISSRIGDTRIIGTLGVGVGYSLVDININSLKTSASLTSFIIRPSIILRSVFARHHALDFTIKYDFLIGSKLGTRFFPDNWYFYLSYAFLSF